MAAHTGSSADTSSTTVSAGARRGLFSRKKKPADPKYVSVKLRDFPKGSILYILRRTLFRFTANGGTDMAAALTYFTVLSIFPALLAIVSLLGVFGHGEESAAVILAFLKDNAPAQMYAIMEDPIKQITGDHGAGLVLLTGILSAIWSASGYTGSFGRALNTVYNVREGRPGWLLKPINVLVTAVLIILVVLMILMMLLGVTVLDLVGQYVPETVDMELIKLIWLNGRWVLILFMAIALITLLYSTTPNVRRFKPWKLSPGAALALFGMGLGAFGFTLYANNFSKYNATYGLIGGVIVMLLFIWIMNNMLLFGAHLDAEIMLMRQIIAGEDDHGHLKIQPRQTSASRAMKARQERLMSAGRELQQQAVGQGMLPKPKGPSIADRVQKAVDTNTTMIRTLIADGKERIENGKEQLQQQAKAEAKAEATEPEAKTDSQQEALFDPSTDASTGESQKN
ncbi:YihY/virulence factor BrkB family protein [Rothia sp. (in: high G+C Gram-positive bacteria)]|uniref:YihY/virulence factor BrkB family protein n=1 Tax=Rothia sp. (in: high G+C Gram-positive bacteria) TaxID=1885016 RepID=UPI0025EF85E9|nr:YihY/virulence factor BrkB family protein [Rothia sp. (in: high G+C Gram-positive bacteria)]